MPRFVRRVRNLCFRTKRVQSTAVHPKTKNGYVWHILVTFKNYVKMRPVGAFNEPVRAPIVELVFSRKHVESTPLRPKTKLGFCLTFWLASKTGLKTCPLGALNASVRAPITKLVFSRQTCPTHYITSKNQIWVCISSFGRLQKAT